MTDEPAGDGSPRTSSEAAARPKSKHAHASRRGSHGGLESALRHRANDVEEIKTSRWHRDTVLQRLLLAKRRLLLEPEQWDELVAEILPDDEETRQARIMTSWDMCCDVFIERVEEGMQYGRLSLNVDQWGAILELLFPEQFADPGIPLDIPPPAEPADDTLAGPRLGRAAETMQCEYDVRNLTE